MIVLVVACVVLVYAGFIPSLTGANRNTNYNYNYNSSNSNSSSNDNSNSSTSSSTLSEDDRHRLFQAAAATQDQALIRRVWERLGLLDSNGSPNEEYQSFMKAHIGWIFRNASWVQTVSDPEKARAYVDEHMPE